MIDKQGDRQINKEIDRYDKKGKKYIDKKIDKQT